MGAPHHHHQQHHKNNNDSSQESSHVRVVTRIRPLSTKESQSGSKASLSCLPGPQPLVQVVAGPDNKRWFEFDAVLDGSSTQEQVYVQSGAKQAICEDLFKGFNCTILAYGQTGAGKTFTMGTAASSDENAGIIPRACADLFAQIEAKCDGNAKVELSYTELYNEQIRDLFQDNAKATSTTTNSNLRIRETLQGEVYVAGVVSKEVRSPQDIGILMEQAAKQRVVASTAMNAVSSRSHAICTLRMEGLVDDNVKFSSKLTLVDLAGSERIKKTGAVGARQAEGININKSLLVLGQVVSALSEKKKPPYRDSKLTRLLQDSLGGNSRTLLVACVSPADCNLDESINTLRYASRARKITNTATRNLVENISPEEAAALKRENLLLKQQVAELQQTIRSLTEQRPVAASPTNTVSTFTSTEDYASADEEEEEDPEGDDASRNGGDDNKDDDDDDTEKVPHQIDVSNDSVEETKQEEPTAAAPLEMHADVAEYLIEISNLKVEVAQLKGELDESKFLAKRHAELQIHFAEVKAEADSARIAASYLSNIVDELRTLKQDDIMRKQQLLQLKIKEQNMFSLVHAMLETYRMQVGRLSTEFDKSVVRTLSYLSSNEGTLKQQQSHDELDDENDDDSVGSMDTRSMAGSVATKSAASLLGGKSVGSFVDTTRSVGSFLYNRATAPRNRSWWKNGRTEKKEPEPVLPWQQATNKFQSKIREVQTSISSDVESLLSNMARLADETKTLETDIGHQEMESEFLLSAYDENNKNELVDHLSSLLVVKQAASFEGKEISSS